MQADEKFKTIMKILRFIIILMMHGSDAECSDPYQRRTQFRYSACCSASKHQKHPSLAHTRRVLGPLSSTNTILMLGYVTTAFSLITLSQLLTKLSLCLRNSVDFSHSVSVKLISKSRFVAFHLPKVNLLIYHIVID